MFCCLPHATTQAIIKALPRGPKVVDLSADFRLRDPQLYEQTYGHPHQALELQEQAVYGLTEHYRDAIRATWLVANPGCYHDHGRAAAGAAARASRLIQPDGIIIDAKSGVSGAGRDAKQGSLFTEVTEGMHAYGVATHRHTPEIEQCLADFAGQPIAVTFTPHLMPMSRGILATIYVRLARRRRGRGPARRASSGAYAGEPFVHVLPFKTMPATRHVRGTNLCLIGVHPEPDARARRSWSACIDNLVKGASGQAIQNMNLMLGLDERLGLGQRPLFP